MKKAFVIFISFFIVSSIFINCSEDEITNPTSDDDNPMVKIINPTDGEIFTEGDTINFIGSGVDHKETNIPDGNLIWTSDKDYSIGTGTSFESDSLSLYRHVITLTGVDNKGRTASKSIKIEIAADPFGNFETIPSGIFKMGSPGDEPQRWDNETQHEVTLTHDFYMSATEVTNRQYAEMAQWAYDNGYCTATNSSLQDNLDGSTHELMDLDFQYCEISFSGDTFTVDSGKETHPVIEVTWYGAACYCDWLSMKAGLTRAYDHSTWQCNGHDPYNAEGYRLPTEAEWEYACRACTQTPFNTGDCLDAGTEANYWGTYPYTGCPSGPNVGWTVTVGRYPANSFDLYEMHGNVWEWCNDWYGSYSGDETNPVGPSTGTSCVLRGGSWFSDALLCRSANRYWSLPTDWIIIIGFRVCRGALAR